MNIHTSLNYVCTINWQWHHHTYYYCLNCECIVYKDNLFYFEWNRKTQHNNIINMINLLFRAPPPSPPRWCQHAIVLFLIRFFVDNKKRNPIICSIEETMRKRIGSTLPISSQTRTTPAMCGIPQEHKNPSCSSRFDTIFSFFKFSIFQTRIHKRNCKKHSKQCYKTCIGTYIKHSAVVAWLGCLHPSQHHNRYEWLWYARGMKFMETQFAHCTSQIELQ